MSMNAFGVLRLLKRVNEYEHELTMNEAGALSAWLHVQLPVASGAERLAWLNKHTPEYGWFICAGSNRYFPMYQCVESWLTEPHALPYVEQSEAWRYAIVDRHENREWHPRSKCTYWNRDWYEDSFLDDISFVCDDCGERFDLSEAHNHDEGTSCNECYREYHRSYDDEDEDPAAKIFDYSTNIFAVINCMGTQGKVRPFSAYTYTPKRREALRYTRLFGVELETHPKPAFRDIRTPARTKNDIVDAVAELPSHNKLHIMKHDSSVEGPEIVTIPCDFEFHKKHYPWKELLVAAGKYGHAGNSTTQCGMHIHVSRASVSRLTQGKLMVFINDPNNRRFVESVAQRSANHYCRSYPKKLKDVKRTGTNEREAVNFSSKGTIELRIFKANLRYERVMKNIEFFAGLLEYLDQCSMQRLTPEAFMAWLTPRRKTYPNLVNFLIEKDWMPESNVVTFTKRVAA